jgi:Domain of unknown function (DUF4331)
MTMNKLSIIFFSVSIAASCGDNIKPGANGDGGNGDGGTHFPAAPSLGAQMDRLGRPAINTVLNHGFDTTGGAAKDAYNQDGSPGGWTAAYAAEFATTLGLVDVLDTGLTCDGMGHCAEAASGPGAGCGNQAFYNGVAIGGGAPVADSYSTLATVLTNDQLFLDTSVFPAELPATHQGYLAVELSAFGVLQNTVGGGRAPTMDVIDTSYTALAIGITGFDTTNQFDPAFKDGVGPHDGVTNTTFPFLAEPN